MYMKTQGINIEDWDVRTYTDEGGIGIACRSPKGKSYKVRFEDSRNIVPKPPTPPQNFRKIIKAIEEMEKSGENFHKIAIVGSIEPVKIDDSDNPLKIVVIFPNLLRESPFSMNYGIGEIDIKELKGRFGLEVKCHIKPLSREDADVLFRRLPIIID